MHLKGQKKQEKMFIKYYNGTQMQTILLIIVQPKFVCAEYFFNEIVLSLTNGQSDRIRQVDEWFAKFSSINKQNFYSHVHYQKHAKIDILFLSFLY